jgi:hypothetical protein
MRQNSALRLSAAGVLAGAVAAVAFPHSAAAQVLFTDNFDAGTSGANYDVFTANAASNGCANFGV